MTEDMLFGETQVVRPTEYNHVTLDNKVFKSIVREIAEEIFRKATMQWSYHDMHDVMGDGKRLPKAQKIYRKYYDYVRSCLRRHYIYKEKVDD